MKATALRLALKEGLGIVERATAKSSTLPILANISLAAQGNALELAATDLEIGIRYRMLAQVKKEGQVVVPPRILSPLLAALEDRSLELHTTPAALVLETSRHTNTVKTISAEDFPIIPSLQDKEERVGLPAEAFCAGLAQVVHVTGQSQARPEISGVFVSFIGKQLKLVATDSFRLAERRVSLPAAGSLEGSFILPQKAAREALSIFGDREGHLSLSRSPTQVIFSWEGEGGAAGPSIQLVSRLLEGEYPEYENIIPQSFQAKAVLDRAELLAGVRVAGIFAGRTNEVRLSVVPAEKRLELSSASGEVGEHKAQLPAEATGEKRVEASFNWRFLADGLSVLKSVQVELQLNGEEAPTLLRPVGDDGYRYILMPIKS
ncbi:DNA polymerase III subunit beta [Patescibacteria group bacterium]|nr:DNA polymerase III subunit beta [Patescibacteria group bacterium]